MQMIHDAVVSHMMENDFFSQWMGVEVLEVKEGYSKIKMTIREEMVNGFGIVHGGLPFSLADSAFAFACNSRNHATVASACGIDYLRPAREGDLLTAEAVEQSLAGKTGVYDIAVTNQEGKSIALFRGKSHRVQGEVIDIGSDA